MLTLRYLPATCQVRAHSEDDARRVRPVHHRVLPEAHVPGHGVPAGGQQHPPTEGGPGVCTAPGRLWDTLLHRVHKGRQAQKGCTPQPQEQDRVQARAAEDLRAAAAICGYECRHWPGQVSAAGADRIAEGGVRAVAQVTMGCVTAQLLYSLMGLTVVRGVTGLARVAGRDVAV